MTSIETPTKGLVSVVVAFYNAERFLEEAIESVLAQTYTQWELLLVDDGSSDSGTGIAREYAARYPGRIYYLAHPGHRNLGMCTSRNLGIRHSKGQYIAGLDSDDVWLPRKLEEQAALMQMHPEVGLLYGHTEFWYDWTGDERHAGKNHIPPLAPSGRVYHPPELLKLCHPLGRFESPSMSDFLARREVLDQISGFVEAFDPEPQMYEDIAFLAKIYLHVPVFVAAECWDRYRIHDKSCSAESDKLGRSEAARRFYFRWLERYLRESQVLDEEIWRVFWRRTRAYRHPWLAALARVIRRTVKAFRGSWLWNALRPNPVLRSAVYFAVEFRKSLAEDDECDVDAIDKHFLKSIDPWDYETSPTEQDRFARQTELLDRLRNGSLFRQALEIGCAEGLFTELLADRCESLQVLDLSPTALERAKARRLWPTHVRFRSYDLRRDSIPGSFDLVVVTGVLEYFLRRDTFAAVREKLVAATAPGGYLLIETTRAAQVVDDAWWARYLIRGRWINTFMARHSRLTTVYTFMNDVFVITLFKRNMTP